MIIPIRCMTCGKVLGDKWNYYVKRVNEMKENGEINDEDARQDVVKTEKTKEPRGQVLDELGLERICCRRHLLSHSDLIDVI